ncbi:thiamine-phosphate pyrophosphorylase [Raineyella antarctica]|uniref:Thiamine-phosphate synthase n=1 Tax=Raineyella antarctica TaxID=1577474 RepID=A0A1G6GDQ3_9ACTN|nr:thiamine phosphate synthase [Raineyella antarctica]SDB79963.1 thiamine-phosphate pyrophosphorylase [Raineyella antarctica]
MTSTLTPALPSDPASRGRRLAALRAARLYLCTDARTAQGDLEAFLHAAYEGGVDIIQLRDKGLEARDEIAALELLARVAAEHGRLFAVNDRADIAALVGADVFHVGQGDLTTSQARALLGPDILVGRSTHSLEQAREAAADPGLDYFCVGPVWATPTKPGRTAVGLDLVADAAEIGDKPWFAIGGIDVERAGRIRAAGAERAVVVRAITQADRPREAAVLLRNALIG